ncbi:MarR family winged helix-turn-helix transcriptional regulator [Sphingomonas sp. HF-S3]|uniref:MarR family winged helix-turn-helix transcriptional regulator n=1 Tax=Sphingomonas rustica TaxID=3103142 RepID=A0ABV0BDR5_9SPHN
MYMHHAMSPAAPSASCACTTLRKASRAVGRVYDEALAGFGMTTAQFAILRHVARAEPVPLSRLAERLVMDRTSLYRALAPIERQGWLTIQPGPGKARLASLTGSGRDAMTSAEAGWAEVQRRIVGAMGERQWSDLEVALRALTDLARHA